MSVSSIHIFKPLYRFQSADSPEKSAPLPAVSTGSDEPAADVTLSEPAADVTLSEPAADVTLSEPSGLILNDKVKKS